MRYEWKFIINNEMQSELLQRILPFVELDKHAARLPEKEYTVRSIYFESPSLEMFHSKRDHLPHRLKVRLRGYGIGGDSSTVFCEIKRKYEAPIVKNRASLSYKNAKNLLRGVNPDEILPKTLIQEELYRFMYQIHTNNLSPLVNVIYERVPFHSKVVDKENNFRITIDKNWRSDAYPRIEELFQEIDTKSALEGQFVMEVKFNKYCSAWMRAILHEMEFVKSPASKYVYCIESHAETIHPEKRFFGLPRLVIPKPQPFK